MAAVSSKSTSGGGPLAHTPLYDLHLELGAKMVPFAGYQMPVNYPAGILAEHQHTRQQAGLFDVSHMGQASLIGADHDSVAAALEKLVPGDIVKLKPGRQRYTQLLNESGGIIDDLMVTRPVADDEDGRLGLVVNASRKDVDYEHIAAHLPEGVRLETHEDRALLALQGPKAAAVLATWGAHAAELPFMAAVSTSIGTIPCHLARAGYTGEDGFEISVASGQADQLARLLLGHEAVLAIGLGARDSLRLEAGLCLYGHDIDETTSPVEADLLWSISKRRREVGGFPGAQRIAREIAEGPQRRRVGIVPQGRAPAREGTEIQHDGGAVGTVTSGGFGPSFGGPIAMGYVLSAHAEVGATVDLMVRGTAREAQIAAMPFVPHRYYRPAKPA